MKLEVLRINSSDDFTSGILFDVSNNKRKFLAYTLEDEHRDQKVMHETRVPAGRYRITLQEAGRFHTKYKSKFASKGADWWKGSILVNNVPNFTGILWHIGNQESATSGCLLLGLDQKESNWVGSSTAAFEKVYPIVRDAVLSGDPVWVEYKDYDGAILSNKVKDYVPKSSSDDNVLEELKQIKTELTALRKAWILKGLQVD
jgi:hypothetical protein